MVVGVAMRVWFLSMALLVGWGMGVGVGGKVVLHSHKNDTRNKETSLGLTGTDSAEAKPYMALQ